MVTPILMTIINMFSADVMLAAIIGMPITPANTPNAIAPVFSTSGLMNPQMHAAPKRNNPAPIIAKKNNINSPHPK